MTLYSNSAFNAPSKIPRRLNTQTPPIYLFGNFDPSMGPWLFQVTSVSLTSDVAMANVTLKSGGNAVPGAIPQVGAKMGVHGTKTSAGAFNVDPTAVLSFAWVSQPAGTATVTYAVTSANVSNTADSGDLIIQPGEAPDLVSAGSAGQSYALWFGPDESDNSRSMFCEAKWSGTLPTAATVVLEVANVDDDGYGGTPVSRWAVAQNQIGVSAAGVVTQSDALATVASSAVTQSGALYNFIMAKFIRAKVLSMTGGDGTTALAVTCFS